MKPTLSHAVDLAMKSFCGAEANLVNLTGDPTCPACRSILRRIVKASQLAYKKRGWAIIPYTYGRWLSEFRLPSEEAPGRLGERYVTRSDKEATFADQKGARRVVTVMPRLYTYAWLSTFCQCTAFSPKLRKKVLRYVAKTGVEALDAAIRLGAVNTNIEEYLLGLSDGGAHEHPNGS
jgi:hypothetical protein